MTNHYSKQPTSQIPRPPTSVTTCPASTPCSCQSSPPLSTSLDPAVLNKVINLLSDLVQQSSISSHRFPHGNNPPPTVHSSVQTHSTSPSQPPTSLPANTGHQSCPQVASPYPIIESPSLSVCTVDELSPDLSMEVAECSPTSESVSPPHPQQVPPLSQNHLNFQNLTSQ